MGRVPTGPSAIVRSVGADEGSGRSPRRRAAPRYRGPVSSSTTGSNPTGSRTEGASDAVASLDLSRAQVRLVMVGLMLGMLLAALDQTIVATALPTIVGDLHGFSHLSWVVTAYLLASTASTPIWGKLGDQYGRKKFFQAAIVIFLIGSVLAGLSRNLNELIALRAVQGLGGGGLIVGAQATVGDVVSPRGARPLPRGLRGRLRGGQRARSAAGWVLRRRPVVAVDLLYQRAARCHRVGRDRGGVTGLD